MGQRRRDTSRSASHEYTAEAVEQDGAKLGVVANADYDLHAAGDHLLNQDAFYLGVGRAGGYVVRYTVVSLSHSAFVGEAGG